jgi:hypothetical protein
MNNSWHIIALLITKSSHLLILFDHSLESTNRNLDVRKLYQLLFILDHFLRICIYLRLTVRASAKDICSSKNLSYRPFFYTMKIAERLEYCETRLVRGLDLWPRLDPRNSRIKMI